MAFIHYPEAKTPPEWGVIIGELTYNLRASLDYLVAELALLDSGKIRKGTQFPIEDTEKGWQRNLKRGYLKGISESHQTIIKRLQPCNGCTCTGILRGISNPDKHTALTWTRVTKLAINPVFSDEGEAPLEINPAVWDASREPVDVYGYIRFEPSLSDGSPVIITLEELVREVSNVLDVFNSEFK